MKSCLEAAVQCEFLFPMDGHLRVPVKSITSDMSTLQVPINHKLYEKVVRVFIHGASSKTEGMNSCRSHFYPIAHRWRACVSMFHCKSVVICH